MLAAVYNEQAVGGLATSILLDGDATWNQNYSIAQYNFANVEMPGGKIVHFPYPFGVGPLGRTAIRPLI